MRFARKENGVALAVSLFMLGLLTIIGVSAVMMSTTHFRLVGNLQTDYEAEMAVQNAIEQYIDMRNPDPFLTGYVPSKSRLPVVMNGREYCVEITPTISGCVTTGSLDRPTLSSHWDIAGRVCGQKIATSSTKLPLDSGIVMHAGLEIPPRPQLAAPRSVCPTLACPSEIVCSPPINPTCDCSL